MGPAFHALSLIGPVLAGWLLVRKISPEIAMGLRAGLGMALGTGVIGTAYFLALLVFDSAQCAIIASEGILVVLFAALLYGRSPIFGRKRIKQSSNRAFFVIFSIAAVLSGAAFILSMDTWKHGGWDAVVLWNLKARFIEISKPSALSAITNPAILGIHGDYPLLLPCLVSRGWQYADWGFIVPASLAILFTVATVIIVVAGLREISSNGQAWIAGCILVGTPFLLLHGVSQYADIVVCCFMTATIVLYGIYDRRSKQSGGLPVLAGMAAAAAACAKNEGILFFAFIVLARFAAALIARTWIPSLREILKFTAGASFGCLTLLVYKIAYSPQNDVMSMATMQVLAANSSNARLHLEILKEFFSNLNFGQWQLSPIPIMIVHAAFAWRRNAVSTKIVPWFTGAWALICMLLSYYAIYIICPYGDWLARSSLNRLLLQLWPIAVFVYSAIASSRDEAKEPEISSRSMWLRAAAILVVALALLLVKAWLWQEKPPRMISGSPQLELSRTEAGLGDVFWIKIEALAGQNALIRYSIDNKPMGQFGIYLGSNGSMHFEVSRFTIRGVYRFVAVRKPDDPQWVPLAHEAVLTIK
jgi:hypothetical protein